MSQHFTPDIGVLFLVGLTAVTPTAACAVAKRLPRQTRRPLMGKTRQRRQPPPLSETPYKPPSSDRFGGGDARAKGTQAAAWPTPYAGPLDDGTDAETVAAAREGSPLTPPPIGDAAADAAAVADAGGRKRPPWPHGDVTTRPPGPG